MATIADIAKKTGLGYSSVAQILQGRTNYKAETVALVTAVAEELGYKPNYLSKSLAGGKSMSIGIYLESTSSQVSTQILYPLESKLHKAGYMSYISTGGKEEHVIQQLGNLLERRIDGLIFHSTTPRNPALQNFFRSISVPVVFIDRPVLEGHPATVNLDYSQALKDMASELKKRGYQSATLLYNTFFEDYPERLHIPYTEALKAQNIKLHIEKKWCCKWNPESEVCAYETVSSNLKAGRKPELLLCYNDMAAVGAIAAIRDAGLKVPEDVAVAGRDGLKLLQYMRPSLTSLARPEGELVAESAFSMLRRMMEDKTYQPVPVNLPVRFEKGGTV